LFFRLKYFSTMLTYKLLWYTLILGKFYDEVLTFSVGWTIPLLFDDILLFDGWTILLLFDDILFYYLLKSWVCVTPVQLFISVI